VLETKNHTQKQTKPQNNGEKKVLGQKQQVKNTEERF